MTDWQAVPSGAQLSQLREFTESADGDRGTYWWKALQDDVELQTVVQEWRMLPDTLRLGILAIVRAIATEDH